VEPLALDLRVEVAGIALKNPVMPASGTFGFGEELSRWFDLRELGAVVTKTITLEPRPGNPPPRLQETYCGLLNSVGLQNPGLEIFLRDKLPFLQELGLPLIVSIAGKTVEEYRELAGRLAPVAGISALEVNISCPNVKEGGVAFGSVPSLAAKVTEAVKEVCPLPVIVKLTPNVTDIVAVARAVEMAGADALALINTLTGMAIDLERFRPALGNVWGGLSGPAIKPVALWAVWRVYEAVKIPLIGMGGIMTGRDALEFILAGATAVAVGTASFLNPLSMVQIIEEIKGFMLQHRISRLASLVGAAHR